MQSSLVDENTTIEELNEDFNHNLMVTKSLIMNLPNPQDRQRVVQWLHKLATSTTDIDEMAIRNILVYYLVLGVEDGKLTEPFTREPPPGPLISLRSLLVDKSSEANFPDIDYSAETSSRQKPDSTQQSTPTFDQAKPMLYQQSPDGGAFLAAQPIPRCGAFCYMAVVARSAQS